MFCLTQSIHCDVLRMLVPAYDLLFGKLALRCLYEDYFEQPRHLSTRIMLKPLEDPNVDLITTVSKVRSVIPEIIYFHTSFSSYIYIYPNRVLPEDYGVMGLRYGSEILSIGTTFMPFPCESKKPLCFKDLNNWNFSIGYGVGLGSPLCPSYSFSLELARSSQVC
ncbi:hypothetical protein B296_00020063 [Ensete ventricosum]|uniref:Uncharacterized protein n=1 Tax=Ensete ventricosum TaxID=4639 RepID=A0A427AEN6_ENSVE|nr:hypothetical protein B296_00020063 [Ensete ventricosum]